MKAVVDEIAARRALDIERELSGQSTAELERAAQHDRPFVELGLLRGLCPALRAAHDRDAHAVVVGRDEPDVLGDELGGCARRFDAHGFGKQGRHERIVPRTRGRR